MLQHFNIILFLLSKVDIYIYLPLYIDFIYFRWKQFIRTFDMHEHFRKSFLVALACIHLYETLSYFQRSILNFEAGKYTNS